MVALVIWLGICTAAGAQAPTPTLPSMTFLNAPLISPATAAAAYGVATSHSSSFSGISGFAGQPPEIVEEARALKSDPDLIFEFVHNQVDTEFAFGARKGPLGALVDRSGTPFDLNILFVDLVRQAGYTAQYVIGTATFSASDFASWSGVSDGRAACLMLASGGIPAAFNGAASSASDCSGLTSFTSVTLLHVWSEVLINGTWYVYDPSFKAHTSLGPVNLVAASGFTSGQPASAAGSSADSGSVSGASYVHNASESALGGYLQTTATTLLTSLRTSNPASDIEGVLGLLKIAPIYKPASGWRNTSLANYTAGVIVTGDMPDQYRTTFQVSYYVNSAIALNQLLYTDEVYARRLQIGTNFNVSGQSPGSYSPLVFSLQVDDVTVQSYTCSSGGYNCLPGSTTAPYTDQGFVTLSINHPYLANGGAYAAQTVVKPVQTYLPITIVLGLGRVTPALGAKWASEKPEDTQLPGMGTPLHHCKGGAGSGGSGAGIGLGNGSGDGPVGDLCAAAYSGTTGDMTRERLGASWLAELSQMLALQGAVGQTVADQQHSIGVVDWRYTVQGWVPHPSSPSNQGPTYIGVADQYTDLNIDTALAVVSKTDNAAQLNAVSRSIALASATLEGSVIEQIQDLPDTASTASRFAWGNQPDDEDPCFTINTPRPFYDFTGTSSTVRSTLYLYEGSAAGCNAQPYISGDYPANRTASEEAAISSYLAAGFHVTASSESYLGPGARFGPASIGTNKTGVYLNFPSQQRGAALIATLFNGSGAVSQVAHVLTSLEGISKGGGGTEPAQTAEYDPKNAADALKDRFIDRSVELGVDLKSGVAGYTTPTLTSVGSGNTPYKLDAKLTFKAADDGCVGASGPCTGPRQGGWNHNWDIRFSLSGSGQEAMGVTSPFAATGTLAAFMAMQDIFSQTSLSTLDQDVYAALAADWWRQQMVGNVATINKTFSGAQYLRLADGSWLAPIGSPGVMTQSGARTKVRDGCGNAYGSTSRRWSQTAVTFSLRNAGGDVMAFAPWEYQYDPNSYCARTYGFEPVSWTFPQGVSLSFAYDPIQGVTGVASSLGRSLTFTRDTVTSPFAITISDGTYTVGQIGGAGVTDISDAASETWKFAVTAPLARSATQRPVPFPELTFVYEPLSPTLPAMAYTYDTRGLVETGNDATGLQGPATHGPYLWYIAEGGRSEWDDPLGGAYTVYYDTDGNAVRHIDQLGRETDSAYDGRHRVVSRTFPEQDQEQFTYDSLDNVLSLSKLAISTSPQAGQTITVSATYEQVWNKLASITDALGNVTTFTYYGSGVGASLMYQAIRPAVNGSSPTYTFAYNAIGLPTSEVDPTGVATTHAYDGFGNLTSTTVATAAANGQPALNLTSTYSYTAQGDLSLSIDPRGNMTGIGNDAMRRKVAQGGYTSSGQLLSYTAWTYDGDSDPIDEYRATAIGSTNNVTAWQTWQTTYTPTHKVKTKVDPLNDTTTYAYDSLDRPSTVTDPTGYVTQYVYDAASQKLQEQRAVGTPIQENYATYTYSLNGKVLSEADARGNAITYGYDGFDRLSTTTYADGTTEQNAYDLNGETTIWTNRAGLSQIRCYDALGRKIAEKSVTGATNTGSCPTGGTENQAADWWDFYDRSFSYDLAGRMLSANSTAGWNRAYTYDAAGRPLTLVDNFGTFTYGHDASGNLVSLSYPTGHVVSYAYDALDRMTGATLDGAAVATFAWDTLSRRTSLTYGDTSWVAYGYDPADRMTSLSHGFPNGTSANVSFGFGYDAAGRLTSETSGNGAYDYVPSASSQTYATANTLNQYPSVNGAARSYWAAGQLFMDSQLSHYYDQAGMLTYVGTVASAGAEALYAPSDAFGRVFVRYHNTPYATPGYPSGVDSILFYSYGPERPETVVDRTYTAPYNASNYTWVGDRAYVLGPAPDERLAFEDINGTVYYPHTDRQGSTIALSTAGADVLTLTYDAYGQPSQTINDLAPGASSYPYLYTGQRYDPTLQAYDYKARIYSAVEGRFWQTDPIGPKDDINLYGYGKNDPLSGGDPTGTVWTPRVNGGNGQFGDFTEATDASLGGVEATAPPPPDKHGTTTIGVTANASIGKAPFAASVSFTAGVAFNKSDAQVYLSGGGTAGAGSSSGASASAGVTLGHHNGDPADTGGFFKHVYGTVGDGVSVTVDHYGGSSVDATRSVQGTQVTVGPGAGVSGGGGGSVTATRSATDIKFEVKAAFAAFYNSIFSGSPLCALACIKP